MWRTLVILLGGCDVVLQLEHIEPATTGCPASYDQVAPSGARYRVDATLVPWADAATRCASHELADSVDRTHLVVIGDDAELDFIRSLTSTAPHWLGLTSRRTEGTFLWVSAEPRASTYPPTLKSPPWATDQPNNPGGACVAINENLMLDGMLYDRECENYQFAFVCECDRYADEPARYTPP